MADVRLAGLTRRYEDGAALEDFTLDLEDGELVVVVGPSGCGKSTLLRLIAGLDEMSAGQIHIGGRRVDGLAPQDRDVAMVFQSYALYPHMTVRRNVEFPLRMRGVAKAARRARVEEVAALLEIEALLERKPGALSGGQRQRVALARALVREPALFLLDEPLSNLDARLRTSVRRHIREVQRRLAVTTLYVTHDQTEAMTLGHRIVVLDQGRTQMVAPPLEAYARPANTFVATFLGSPGMNLLSARRQAGAITIGDQRIELGDGMPIPCADGAGLTVGVRPEAFVVANDAGAVGLRVDADPASAEPLGAETMLTGNVGGQTVVIRAAGTPATATSFLAPREILHFFDADGRRFAP